MFGKKKKKKKKIKAALFILFFFPVSLHTAQTAFAETFSFSGESMETVLAKGKERTVLSGGAEVQSDNNIIRADVIELFGSNFRFIQCKGQVSVVNNKKGIEITCQELFYNRHDKVVRVNGNVILLDKENEMVVKGGFLENWEETDETLIQIGVRILKKDLVCRSEFARYLRADDRLELSGMPVVNWKGDEYRALKIFIDLGKDTIRLEGDIRGKVSTGEEDEQPRSEPVESGAEE